MRAHSGLPPGTAQASQTQIQIQIQIQIQLQLQIDTRFDTFIMILHQLNIKIVTFCKYHLSPI